MLALRSGARLGNYELVRVIGRGGMGVVYEAKHEALGRRVAIKVLHALASESPRADVSRARFLREGRAAAQVRHEHVVDVFDFGMHDGTPFLVMELVEGESLAERIERESVLPLSAAIELILPILSAVGALHAAGIIHRDLKPANILIGRGGSGEVSPKVADFGVSRVDDDDSGLTESGVVVGSYPYMPPEQARACKNATEQADQYSLGAILYECVTGKRPFEGASPYDLTHAILNAPLVPPTERNGKLPGALDAVLLRALNRDPEGRFPCVEELGAALLPFAEPEVVGRWAGEFLPSRAEKAVTGAGTIPPVASSSFRFPAAPLRRVRAAIGVGSVAVAGILIAAVAFHQRPSAHDGAAGGGTPALAVAEPVAAASPRQRASASIAAEPKDPGPAPAPAQLSSGQMPTSDANRAAASGVSALVHTTPAKAAASARAKRGTTPAETTRQGGSSAEHRDDESAPDNGAPLLDPRR